MVSTLHHQWQIFLLALAFFSRIPIPANVPYSSERLNQANRYFGAVGILIGAFSALVYALGTLLFVESVAIVLAMVASLILTGVFHEDGLADTADGLGGGYRVEDKLRIMKDSRIGTYGATALVMALLIKFVCLSAVDSVVWALILGHGLSRCVAASLLGVLPYVSDESGSKSKPLANQQSSRDRWILALTAIVLLSFLSLKFAAVMALLMLCLHMACRIWLKRQIGGFTGDTLGAAQQLSELAIYLVLSSPLLGAGL